MRSAAVKPQTQIRANRSLVLRLLRRRRQLSRAEIAQRTGLSVASVSRIVAELIRQHLVTVHGVGHSTGGRPAIRLRLDDSYYRSIAVDVHSSGSRVGVGTLSGSVLETEHVRTPAAPMKTLDLIAERVELLRAGFQEGTGFAGVGLSLRGLVNSRTGVVERGHEKAWTGIPVKQYLEARLRTPVMVENNVRAAAFAEYHYGNPDVRDSACLVFLMVNEGIGVSLLLRGDLFYGEHMAAGEFGQMVISDSHVTFTHDRPGCLERLASDEATAARYYADNGESRRPVAGDLSTHVKQICQLAMGGDARARKALRTSVRYLGIGISNLVWGLDPDSIVIDGTLTEAWPLVLPVIQDQFADGREFSNFRNLLVRPSALGGQAAIIGAAALPFQSLFKTGEHARL